MIEEDFENKPFILPDAAALREYEIKMEALLDSCPQDDYDISVYCHFISIFADIVQKNSCFQDQKVRDCLADFLKHFDKIYRGQWKQLKYICVLLQECETKHAETIALKFMDITVKLLNITAIKQTSNAHKARREIGRKNRIDMRKYYDPIRESTIDRFHITRTFQKQFDLFWEDHHAEIKARAAARRGKKSSKKNIESPNSTAGKHPHELYPTHFASFRTGFYRWRKRYEIDRKQLEIDPQQQKINKFIDQLFSLHP